MVAREEESAQFSVVRFEIGRREVKRNRNSKSENREQNQDAMVVP